MLEPQLYSDSISYLYGKLCFEVSIVPTENASSLSSFQSFTTPLLKNSCLFAPSDFLRIVHLCPPSPLLLASWKNLEKLKRLYWSPVCVQLLNVLCVLFCPVL